MTIKLVYNNNKDRDFFNLLDLKVPIFVEYIDVNTIKGKKEGRKLMNYYGAKKFPFVEITLEDEKKIPIYGEDSNPIYKINDYINESKN